MSESIKAYPLCWPAGQPRTPSHKVTRSRFGTKLAQHNLLREIRLLGGKSVIISSNVPVRQDGQPYADAARRRITDAGVAVYFTMKGEQKCFACDRWDTPDQNIRAIGMSIEALRGIERWGSSDMVDRAFRGYTALPSPMVTPVQKPWREVMGFDRHQPITMDQIKSRYRVMAHQRHPDRGGSDALMAELNRALDDAKKEICE